MSKNAKASRGFIGALASNSFALKEQALKEEKNLCSCGKGIAQHSIPSGEYSFGRATGLVDVCNACRDSYEAEVSCELEAEVIGDPECCPMWMHGHCPEHSSDINFRDIVQSLA
jgi:hypothetical protein